MKLYALPIRFGIATAGCLIAYFLILSLLNLHINPFFSVFNGVITGFGIYESIKFFKTSRGEKFGYGTGFSAGLLTGFIATIIFTVFFALYATELNTNFLQQLSPTWYDTYASFQAIVFFTVAIMGFATSVVLTLAFMQLFKSSNNLRKKTS